jgi:serine/threonine-protein kinase PknG
MTCAQPGCTGTIEDGYCNVCGMAATPAPTGTAPMGAAPGSGRTGSGRTPSTRSGRSSRSTRSGRSGRGSARTGRAVGAIPLARPPLPPQDPLAAIVEGIVPERKRFCSNCEAKLKRDSGYCPKCGQEYSFVPTLKPGDVIAGKYEIKGTIAFGGLGWIYLGLDTVLSRWVILKGLLNSKDPRMIEVAVKEREYLAAVKHPNIVGIYDFIQHGSEGFIVMEYVNGKTLMTLRKERGGPLPVAEAISYVIEILPAFGYLDEAGLVYCDFKPENAMVEEDTVKLIDMGAVRRQDDQGGDVYGSVGYTAPEAHDAPTPVSDLYSVGRALAVLVANFDFQGQHKESLPSPDEVDVFKQHEPLHRFLLKATRHKPEERFQTASEMTEQLVGVLRTVVAAGEIGHIESAFFDPDSDHGAGADGRGHDGLPRLKVDREDAAAGVILAAGAVNDPARRLAMFERALKQFPDSLELKLRFLDELVNLGRYPDAELNLGVIQQQAPTDWRVAWYRGKCLLAQGKAQETLAAFTAIMDDFPGELAPKHALGRAYEAKGELDRAIAYYDAVSRADASFTGAAFGLARCFEKKGDRNGAADAYRRVPSTSSRYGPAQLALAHVLVDAALRPPVTQDEVVWAAEALEALHGLMDGAEVHRCRAAVFLAGATLVERTRQGRADVRVLGVPMRNRALRFAAEAELRACARMAEKPEERLALVDEANRARPMTWV